jgi:hypothetical protein
MPIDFKCPHCQAALQAASDLASTQGVCPKCNKVITVPSQDAEPKSEGKGSAKKG